ncbi:MAG: hypothetical protein KDB65_05435 [Calditrichaeota bacterium]|nr:hypothetical protein [Calditrichota bacterium]
MQNYIRNFIVLALILSGCTMSGKSVLRIAISNSPGSSIMYVAQEKKLFRQYEVDIELVELNTGCECMQALSESNVDAAIIPFSEYSSLPNTGMGVLLLVAVSNNEEQTHLHSHLKNDWQTGHADILVGDRSELMTRRLDWQRVLLAYEHARMLLQGEPDEHSRITAEREHRSIEAVSNDLMHWKVFGITQQDSLLGVGGPFASMNAQWQGRQFLTAAATLRLEDTVPQKLHSGQTNKAK